MSKNALRFSYVILILACLPLMQLRANPKPNCLLIELNNKNPKVILDFINEHASENTIFLDLNYAGGDFSLSMYLAKLVHQYSIPVNINYGSLCSNDCSAIYLASPSRHSEIPINFPNYSEVEKQQINSVPKTLFTPIFQEGDILSFFRNKLTPAEYNSLAYAATNHNYDLTKSFNKKDHIVVNSPKICNLEPIEIDLHQKSQLQKR